MFNLWDRVRTLLQLSLQTREKVKEVMATLEDLTNAIAKMTADVQQVGDDVKLAIEKLIRARQQYKQGLDQGLADIRALLENADMIGARAAVGRLMADWPDSERVQRLARLIAPPVFQVRHGNPKPSRTADHQWLHDHVHDYPGQWVAVLGGELVASDRELRVILEQARSTTRPDEVLLHFQPSNSK